MKGTLTWQRLATGTNSPLSGWRKISERHWLESSWRHVEREGLNCFSDDFEYSEVVIRLISLTEFYRNFCLIFGGGTRIPSQEKLAKKLDLTARSMMLLIGKNGDWTEYFTTYFNEKYVFTSALEYHLQKKTNKEILSVVFKGCKSFEWLFGSLLNSVGVQKLDWCTEDFPSLEDTPTADDYDPLHGATYVLLKEKWDALGHDE